MDLGKRSLFIINTDQLDLQFILQKRKKPLETFQKATCWKSCSQLLPSLHSKTRMNSIIQQPGDLFCRGAVLTPSSRSP